MVTTAMATALPYVPVIAVGVVLPVRATVMTVNASHVSPCCSLFAFLYFLFRIASIALVRVCTLSGTQVYSEFFDNRLRNHLPQSSSLIYKSIYTVSIAALHSRFSLYV